MGHGDVGEGKPDHHEQQDGREADPLGKRPQYQAAGDGGKRSLEDHIDELGYADPLGEGCGNRVGGYPQQEELGEVAKEGTSFGEGQTIPIGYPENGGQTEDGKHLHQYGEHVFGANQTAVEERESGDRHQDDKRRGDDQPCVITLVDRDGWSRRSRFAGGGRGDLGGRFGRCYGFIAPGRTGEAKGSYQCQNCK